MRRCGVTVPETYENIIESIIEVSKQTGCHRSSITQEYLSIKPKLFNPLRNKAHFFSSISNENLDELE